MIEKRISAIRELSNSIKYAVNDPNTSEDKKWPMKQAIIFLEQYEDDEKQKLERENENDL